MSKKTKKIAKNAAKKLKAVKKHLRKTKMYNEMKDKSVLPAVVRNELKKTNKKVIQMRTEDDSQVNVDKLPEFPSEKSPRLTRKQKRGIPLRERMLAKLKGARFRYLNEEMYTREGRESMLLFKSDPEAFTAYHDGYRLQVKQWPMNPLHQIISWLNNLSADLIVADFGCGDAQLAASVPQTVHSFDLVAVNSRVTACDMAHCPLSMDSVDIAVYCLSLMGTNLRDYLMEANRVLKMGGILKIAEVESRFDQVDDFVEAVQRFGFQLVTKDYTKKLFYFFEFKKSVVVKNSKKLPTVSLHPCLYKKR